MVFKTIFVVAVFIGSLGLSEAEEALNFAAGQVKTNLAAAVTVQHPLFSIHVPKGWSLAMQDEGTTFQNSITLTPSSQIDKDTTYVGFHILAKTSLKTLLTTEALFKKKPEAKTKHQKWNGQDWFIAEYPAKNAQNKPVTDWLAFAEKNGSKYMVAAGTSKTEEKSNIETILSSIVLK